MCGTGGHLSLRLVAALHACGEKTITATLGFSAGYWDPAVPPVNEELHVDKLRRLRHVTRYTRSTSSVYTTLFLSGRKWLGDTSKWSTNCIGKNKRISVYVPDKLGLVGIAGRGFGQDWNQPERDLTPSLYRTTTHIPISLPPIGIISSGHMNQITFGERQSEFTTGQVTILFGLIREQRAQMNLLSRTNTKLLSISFELRNWLKMLWTYWVGLRHLVRNANV